MWLKHNQGIAAGQAYLPGVVSSTRGSNECWCQETLADVTGKHSDDRWTSGKFVTQQKTNECLHRKSRCADVEQNSQARKCLNMGFMKYCMSWLHGAASESARTEVIYTAESTEPENSWQRMTSISLHAPQCAMHSMLAFCSKAQHQKGLKMMLNISLALLKSTDHAEPLKLHSLFYPSSQNINANLIITNTIKSCTEYQQILGIVLAEKFSSRVKKFTKTSGSVKQKSRLQQLLL